MVGASAASSPRMLLLSAAPAKDGSLLLTLVPARGGAAVAVRLRGSWASPAQPPAAGEVARVVLCSRAFELGQWDTVRVGGEIVVDDQRNLLVMYPDTLVSGTAVADSFVCLRKSVLSGRNPRGCGTAGVAGAAALQGSMIHDMFQAVLVKAGEGRGGGAGVVDWEDIDDGPLGVFSVIGIVEDVVAAHRMDVYSANMTEAAARAMLMRTLPSVLRWVKAFLWGGEDGVRVRDRKVFQNVRVAGVRDIEESIWSPVFGLKGKVDASVDVVGGAGAGAKAVLPLELKTGSSKGYAGVSHYAQVVLYMMLMSDRYEESTTEGLLTYIRAPKDGSGGGDDLGDDGCNGTTVVRMMRDELVGLVMQRNALARYLAHNARIDDLPPMLEGKPTICDRCFALDSCVLQHRLLEGGKELPVDTGPSPQVFAEKTIPFKVENQRYYAFWKEAMAQEEAHSVKGRAELWAMSARDREESRRCWAGLQISVSEEGVDASIITGRRLPFMFKRGPAVLEGAEAMSAGNMSVGDYVAVSVQAWDVESCSMANGALVPNITAGFLDSISATAVTVLTDMNIFHWCAARSRCPDKIVWRIDAEEIVASFSTAKSTIESLFVAEASGGFRRLRCLVAELQTPKFTPLGEADTAALDALTKELGKRGMVLNDEQQEALRMSREAKDYLLLLGMPGTGKTATLATIVLAAVRSGQTVLLCSHTRTAVDNILSRLLDIGFTDFVRVGSLGATGDSRIAPYHVDSNNNLTVDQLVQKLHTPSVVATTCLGISHAVFARRSSFDVVLVDEASQILQPICLGPLRFVTSSFVLVGDHYQLPPLMRAEQKVDATSIDQESPIIDDGSPHADNPRESLFRRLCEAHPAAVVSLVRQYRMAEDIMRLSNELVYNGNLSCGTPQVAARMLDLEYAGPRANTPPWLEAALNPMQRVVFLDTDALGAGEASADTSAHINEFRSESASRQSSAEARIIRSAITAMCSRGLPENEIAVLSPFRAQVSYLRSSLQSTLAGKGDICTIDQYQGKDKDCVVVSFVRSNDAKRVGPLLSDWRRINVAVTRARRKLVLVGSASTLAGGCHFLSEMVALLRTTGSIYAVDELPSQA